MASSLVMTVIGPDKPGLVESLSSVVADHDANWLDSRMAHLAGQFAGILRVGVNPGKSEALIAALEGLGGQGLRVTVASSVGDTAVDCPTAHLELVGNDRPGIVRQIAATLSAAGVNVEELATECVDAPMSGDPLFKATATVGLPVGLGVEALRASLERIAHDLMVEITVE